MKIYYFLKDDSNDDWHDIEQVAWLEKENCNSGIPESSFKMIEHIRIHASKGDRFQNITFRTDFGRDTSIGSFSKNPRELIKTETNNGSMYSSASRQVDRNEYECVRKKVFDIYQKEMFLDLDKLIKNQPKEK